MNLNDLTRRAFGRSLPSLKNLAADASDVEAAQPESIYDKLFSLSVLNGYYGDETEPGQSSDFTIVPTKATQQIMADLRLLMSTQATEITVVHDTSKLALLERDLERRADLRRRRVRSIRPQYNAVPEDNGRWTCLTFQLFLGNPLFVNFSDIPLDMKLPEESFYFTNRTADDRGVIHPGDRSILTVRPTNFPVLVHRGEILWIEDASGQIVWPRELPTAATADNQVWVDLAGQPDGLYTAYKAEPNPSRAFNTGIVYEERFLLSTSSPKPLGFVDIYLTNPDGGKAGRYPVELAPGSRAIVHPVDYRVQFDARHTYWTYYVVPKAGRYRYTDLSIQCEPGPGPNPVFASGGEEILPNGRLAYRIVSETPIALRNRLKLRLRLTGQRSDAGDGGDTLMDALPGATPDLIRTVRDPSGSGNAVYSDIYVYI